MTTNKPLPVPAVLVSLPRKSVDLWSQCQDAHTDFDWAYARRCLNALAKRAKRGDKFAASAVLPLRQDRIRARMAQRDLSFPPI